jgi:hypothetical protein
LFDHRSGFAGGGDGGLKFKEIFGYKRKFRRLARYKLNEASTLGKRPGGCGLSSLHFGRTGPEFPETKP